MTEFKNQAKFDQVWNIGAFDFRICFGFRASNDELIFPPVRRNSELERLVE